MGTAAVFVTAAFPALGGLLPWAPSGQKLLFKTMFLLFSIPNFGMPAGDGKLWQNLGKLLGCRHAGLFWH